MPFFFFRNKKRVCFVDLTGQNKSISGSKIQTSDSEENSESNSSSLCKVGFAENCGNRNKYVVCLNEIHRRTRKV
jgi:hypothetical protein